MRKITLKITLFLILIALPVFILFNPMFKQFFSADDWVHLRVAQINSFSEFTNFFKFKETAQRVSFYRPLPTQLFFFSLQEIFGLNSQPYYIFVFLFFIATLFLLNIFLEKITNNKKLSLVITLMYAVSHTHVTHLFFLSAFQEISLVFWTLLSLIYFQKNSLVSKFLSLLFFIAALMSKETAIVIPILWLLADLLKINKLEKIWQEIKRIIADKKFTYLLALVISAVYLYLRFFVFGFKDTASGSSYHLDLSPKLFINSFLWYSLWSVGSPETLVNYLPSWFSVLPRYFTDFPLWGKPILMAILSSITFLIITLIFFLRKTLIQKKLELKTFNKIIFGSVWFLVTLLPFIFFPQHKFALELGLPLIGFLLAVIYLIENSVPKLTYLFLIFYLLLNIFSIQLTINSHYSILRSKISHNVFTFFKQNIDQDTLKNKIFVFKNDTDDHGKDWGSSKQIKQALMDQEFFRVVYPNQKIKVYYQDDNPQIGNDELIYSISTQSLIN